MQQSDHDALLGVLRQSAEPGACAAIEALIGDAADHDLARINAIAFAAAHRIGEEDAIAAFLHASRLGLFEMSWNILCRSCAGVLDANTSLKTVRQEEYHCAFCAVDSEPTLDDAVEVSFAVSPRVRRIAAHDPASLGFWDYHRQVFFGSGVAFPEPSRFNELARRTMLETIDLQPGERMVVSVTLPAEPVVVFDPVTHAAHFIDVSGEPTEERQELSLVFNAIRAAIGRAALRPGPLRLSLDNRSDARVLPGIFLAGEDLAALIGGRRPYLTAKRLLSNQTFRDIYRTDTLAIDQRLKILSLSFVFTDLKGSTELYERVGDLVAYDIVRNHFRILHEIVAEQGGAVVKTIGDAVMATFPSPDRALSAALRIRESMRRLNARLDAEDLVLKIGIHEGPCLAVSLNDRQDYFGQTVNLASRVQELATSETIIATEPVVRHAASARILQEGHVEAASRDRAIRGMGDRVPVFELN